MRTRWIAAAALLAIVIGVIAAAVVWDGPGDWRDRDKTIEVVRVVDDDGTTVSDGETVIIERGGGIFPFGIFIFPLGILVTFLLLRLVFGGPPRRGPWNGGGPPEWLDEWHRRQHEATSGMDGRTGASGT